MGEKGSQATLNGYKNELWAKCGTRNKLKFDIQDLTAAKERMSDLHVSFLEIRRDIISAMDSYNCNGNEWVSVCFDEMSKSADYIKSIYDTYYKVYSELQTMLADKEYSLSIVENEISSLERKINNFTVVEEEEVVGP